MEIINIGESGNMEPNKDDFEQELIELSKKINNC